MSRSDISIGLDIGTSAVKAVAVRKDFRQKTAQVLGTGFFPVLGIRKGTIVDVEKVTKSIEGVLADLQRNSGIKSSRVLTNLSGCHIQTLESRGTIAVSRADGEITREDVERVIAESQKVPLPPNREIIHIIPKSFIVDGERGVKDAEGLHGVRLEVESLLVLASTPAIKNLMKCLGLLDLQAEDLVVAPFASAHNVLTSQDRELGVLVLDIGAAITDLSVFEEGDLIHLAVLPIGSAHITNDIAIGLRVPIDLAEKIKIEHGVSAISQIGNRKETFDISKIYPKEAGVFSRKELAEIIEARLCEIFDLVNKELKKIARQNLLPAGIVLTGGGAKLPGIIEVAKRELRLPCRLGGFFASGSPLTEETEGMIMEQYDPSFSCAAGLAFWKFHNIEAARKTIDVPGPILGIFRKIKNWLKIFLP